ncbi:ribose 5-phosphate isomerase B [Yunchengibacter salinarum]|uniref:ribose 5-phosphate isomerase B n=1 Tax=Yunchengibacter salinarum TaxID=3133399 RepID=UPI0035B5D0F0
MTTITESVALASDHAGFALKEQLRGALEAAGYAVIDLGTHSEDRVDYPDYGAAMGRAITEGKAGRGVIVCGSGIGIAIAANRFPAVRAATVHDHVSARLSREHNDANVLSLGARLIGPAVAEDCLFTFLETPFEGGRHADRVAKL